MIKKVAFALALIGVCFSVLYYVDGRDYLSGKERHYVGTSTISADEFVILADNRSLPFSSVSEIEVLENGLVEITYNFFSADDYSFLTAAPFSYLDTRVANSLYDARNSFYTLAVSAIILLAGIRLLRHCPIKVEDATQKIENAAWYMMHPLSLLHRQQAPLAYSSQIQTTVEVTPKAAGIYATRTWKYRKGYLYSSGWGQAQWGNKVLLADKIPAENNENGVYALRLGVTQNDWEFMKHILGIVSLSGEWLEHEDGVLRAESCEIILLIVSHYHKAVAFELSSTYGVPVIVANNPINTYLAWLYSENGVECLLHNANILKG